MERAGAPKGDEREFAGVMSALDRDDAERIRHIAVDDRDYASSRFPRQIDRAGRPASPRRRLLRRRSRSAYFHREASLRQDSPGRDWRRSLLGSRRHVHSRQVRVLHPHCAGRHAKPQPGRSRQCCRPGTHFPARSITGTRIGCPVPCSQRFWLLRRRRLRIQTWSQ